MGVELFVAGALAIIGGALGFGIGSKNEADKASEIREQLRDLEEDYINAQEEAKLKYEAAKKQAERNAQQADLQADLTDKQLDIGERSLSVDFNTAIDNLYLNQMSDAQNWNMAAMQAGSSTGASYANLANSGIRAGSSLSDAVLMESAVNENQLQFAKESKRRSDNNSLASVLNSLAGNEASIEQNRVGADITRDNAAYLRNSYLEGGTNYNLYQLQLKQLESSYIHNNTALEREKGRHEGSNTWLNALASAFGFGSKGYSTGYKLTGSIMDASGYNTQLGGEG